VVDLPWRDYVTHDVALERRLEPKQLVGNPAKIRETLGWCSQHTFEDLVREMVEADLVELKSQASPEPLAATR